MEAKMIFNNLFTVCSLCNWKFVVCPFVDEETNGSYPFAYRLKELNRLNGLAHLWTPLEMTRRAIPVSPSS